MDDTEVQDQAADQGQTGGAGGLSDSQAAAEALVTGESPQTGAAAGAGDRPRDEAGRFRSLGEAIKSGVGEEGEDLLAKAERVGPESARDKGKGPAAGLKAKPIPPKPGEKQAAQPAQGQPAKPGQAGQAVGYMFAGRQYRSREEAERDFKGHFERSQKFQTSINEYQDKLNRALEANEAWAKFFREGKFKDGAPGTEGGKKEAPPRLPDALNLEAVVHLAKTDGLPSVVMYLAEKFNEHLDAEVKRLSETFETKLRETSAPLQSSMRESELRNRAMQLFREAASSKDDAGNFRFPGLNTDEALTRGVVDLWRQLPPEFAYSELGVQTAYLLHKAQSPLPSGGEAALAEAEAESPGRQVQTLDGGRTPVAPPGRSQPTPLQQQARIARDLITGGNHQGPGFDLGFPVGG